MPTIHDRRPGPHNPHWVLTKIIDGDVQRTPDLRYEALRVHGRSNNLPGDCTDAVYHLEDLNLVELHHDGTVTPTTAGRRKAGTPPTPARQPAAVVHFQAA
jgi:hypothetical protein